MTKHYRTATFKDGLDVVNNIRDDDRMEVEASGHSPLDIPFWLSNSEHPTAVCDHKGKIAGVAGVIRLNDQVGLIWLLCTPAIEDMPIAFYRQAQCWLKGIQKDYQLLWNHCDVRNKAHHRLLKFLGFSAINMVYIRNNPFYEIVKLCVPESKPPLQ